MPLILPLPPRLAGRTCDLDGLFRPDGAIALSLEPGLETHAFTLAVAVDDIVGLGVRDARRPGPRPRLRLHVGAAEPPAGTGPLLLWRPGTGSRDLVLRFAEGPAASFGPLAFTGLGRAVVPADGRVLLEDGHGPIATQEGERLRLLADLPLLRAEEILAHATATSRVPVILAAGLVLRELVGRLLPRHGAAPPALSLITIDAEDQQRYFLNRAGHCSTIVGVPDDDLQFARCCRTIMERCEAEGLKAIFMVTGDEIDPGFRDAFGDALVGLDANRRVLAEMPARGHDVACHGFDHEWWLSKGHSANPRMSLWQKLAYFAQTSGDVRMLGGLARFLWRHRRELAAARARKNAREASVGTAFTVAEVDADLERWCRLVGHQGPRLFIRYPGFVRSAATLEALDARFAQVVDSSDLYELDPLLPVHPYRLLAERDGRIRRTGIVEIPCVFIDKTLRTRDQAKVEAYLDRLATVAGYPGSVLSLVTHTKVLGGSWGHCHLYLHDPLRGMALPMVEQSWRRFTRLLRERTTSSNWRDLERVLFAEVPCPAVL